MIGSGFTICALQVKQAHWPWWFIKLLRTSGLRTSHDGLRWSNAEQGPGASLWVDGIHVSSKMICHGEKCWV